ncbi:DNA-directed RNA polymerase subunit RPC12/RpoP [Paenarthrobacter nicotinovorans]|uniref:hypothetical protein n=1 Tax=Micrococcaceae TaxID=1268 RepID=UPI0008767CB4|nr:MULTISPECIES: hypothetical protein [Micrococcaceae]MDR6436971.1 DNA-directed RNA polymerase subunit RPC12/RpoP [Paenarthrobacter nicotinovorans]SCZ55044.1 hypothetical protein SAMN02799638_01644 [Arthrobacter sp. UNCCL28]
MPKRKNPLISGDAPHPPGDALACASCGTSYFLNLETIESLEPHAGELMVRVAYTCSACESAYEHNASFRNVAAVLNRKESFAGLLQFGGTYLHCGEPMTFAKNSGRSVYAPISTEDVDEDLPDVYLKTRVIQCRCGFRMELPA